MLCMYTHLKSKISGKCVYIYMYICHYRRMYVHTCVHTHIHIGAHVYAKIDVFRRMLIELPLGGTLLGKLLLRDLRSWSYPT